MADRPFVHLHCHTHYSLLDGASRVPELVALVKSLGMNACAITDHGNLYGAVEFYRECRDSGLNPIIGYQAAIDGANPAGPPLVTTRHAHYLKQEDAQAHDVLLCINTGKTLDDEHRLRYGSDQFYVREPEEMYRLFPERHGAVKRSQEI